MDRNKVAFLTKRFDAVAHKEDEIEFWLARDLQGLLGYKTWENFETTIKRAMSSVMATGIEMTDHFREVTKMVLLGSGAKREIKDYMLTRYACYLIAQNGDPKKEEIAFAQSYFAVQTRKQEMIEERISYIERMEARGRLRDPEKRLSQNIYERGVDERGFGRIRSKGDKALFGGSTTQDMKDRYGIKTGPLADRLPTLTIAAKNLATEMTNFNVEQKDLQGETKITEEHVQNNSSVRAMLGKRGIRPEELPPDEDIKKLERRVKKQEKELSKRSGILPKLSLDEQEGDAEA
nr:DNA damage-inducible protein D [uncultured Intestinimonas sp.]